MSSAGRSLAEDRLFLKLEQLLERGERPDLERLAAEQGVSVEVARSLLLSLQALAAPASASRRGRIGPYELRQELARGGMGVVYLAHDPLLGRDVALKVLTNAGCSRQQSRFWTEAQALATLRHPNLLTVHAAGEHEGEPWLALELVQGGDCSERLPLVPAQAAQVVIEVADALQHCHERGVLHRDLKPSNVLMTAQGRILLADFGLALLLVDEEAQRTRLTQTGALLGTPGYWPPEQARGSLTEVGVHSDVYGLGALLYGLLTARPPISGAGLLEVALATEAGAIEPLGSLTEGIDERLEGICMRCLARDPQARYPSAAAVAAALRGWAAAPPAPGRDRRWLGAASLSLAALLALLVSARSFTAAPPSIREESTASPLPARAEPLPLSEHWSIDVGEAGALLERPAFAERPQGLYLLQRARALELSAAGDLLRRSGVDDDPLLSAVHAPLGEDPDPLLITAHASGRVRASDRFDQVIHEWRLRERCASLLVGGEGHVAARGESTVFVLGGARGWEAPVPAEAPCALVQAPNGPLVVWVTPQGTVTAVGARGVAWTAPASPGAERLLRVRHPAGDRILVGGEEARLLSAGQGAERWRPPGGGRLSLLDLEADGTDEVLQLRSGRARVFDAAGTQVAEVSLPADWTGSLSPLRLGPPRPLALAGVARGKVFLAEAGRVRWLVEPESPAAQVTTLDSDQDGADELVVVSGSRVTSYFLGPPPRRAIAGAPVLRRVGAHLLLEDGALTDLAGRPLGRSPFDTDGPLTSCQGGLLGRRGDEVVCWLPGEQPRVVLSLPGVVSLLAREAWLIAGTEDCKLVGFARGPHGYTQVWEQPLVGRALAEPHLLDTDADATLDTVVAVTEQGQLLSRPLATGGETTSRSHSGSSFRFPGVSVARREVHATMFVGELGYAHWFAQDAQRLAYKRYFNLRRAVVLPPRVLTSSEGQLVVCAGAKGWLQAFPPYRRPGVQIRASWADWNPGLEAEGELVVQDLDLDGSEELIVGYSARKPGRRGHVRIYDAAGRVMAQIASGGRLARVFRGEPGAVVVASEAGNASWGPWDRPLGRGRQDGRTRGWVFTQVLGKVSQDSGAHLRGSSEEVKILRHLSGEDRPKDRLSEEVRRNPAAAAVVARWLRVLQRAESPELAHWLLHSNEGVAPTHRRVTRSPRVAPAPEELPAFDARVKPHRVTNLLSYAWFPTASQEAFTIPQTRQAGFRLLLHRTARLKLRLRGHAPRDFAAVQAVVRGTKTTWHPVLRYEGESGVREVSLGLCQGGEVFDLSLYSHWNAPAPFVLEHFELVAEGE